MSFRSLRGGDDGNAIIEFVFVAIAVILPLLYLVVGAFALQRESFAGPPPRRRLGRSAPSSLPSVTRVSPPRG
jgi:hypothetical protein